MIDISGRKIAQRQEKSSKEVITMMHSDQWELFGKAMDKLSECAQIGLDNDVQAISVDVRIAHSISLLESLLDRRQAELDY